MSDAMMTEQSEFGLTPLELARIVTLEEASRLSSESIDTLRRRHADKIINLSPRRVGMRVRDVLRLGTRKA
jgi:hypothetical protein